jgi:hypothetical protein
MSMFKGGRNYKTKVWQHTKTEHAVISYHDLYISLSQCRMWFISNYRHALTSEGFMVTMLRKWINKCPVCTFILQKYKSYGSWIHLHLNQFPYFSELFSLTQKEVLVCAFRAIFTKNSGISGNANHVIRVGIWNGKKVEMIIPLYLYSRGTWFEAWPFYRPYSLILHLFT